MHTKFIFSLILVLALCAQGCTYMGLQADLYSEDHLRVDQEMDGNLGYLTGFPPEGLPPAGKPTQRTYGVVITQTERAPISVDSIIKFVMKPITLVDEWVQENMW